MENLSSVRDLINLWPKRAELAADIRALAGAPQVSTGQVHKWAENSTVPAKYHFWIVEAGRARGLPVSADLIVRLHGFPCEAKGEAA